MTEGNGSVPSFVVFAMAHRFGFVSPWQYSTCCALVKLHMKRLTRFGRYVGGLLSTVKRVRAVGFILRFAGLFNAYLSGLPGSKPGPRKTSNTAKLGTDPFHDASGRGPQPNGSSAKKSQVLNLIIPTGTSKQTERHTLLYIRRPFVHQARQPFLVIIIPANHAKTVPIVKSPCWNIPFKRI